MPASEKNSTSMAMADAGRVFDRPARSEIWVTGLPSRSIVRMKAKTPTFMVT